MDRKYLLFVLASLLVSQTSAEEATCNFFMQSGPGPLMYTCELSLNGFEGSDITTITGNHLPLRSDANVRRVVRTFGQSSSSFPSVICSQFPSLEEVIFRDFGLTSLDQHAIVDCHNLRHLELMWHEISSVHVDAFANNRQLTVIDLSRNRISSLDDGVFNGLGSLQRLDLSVNYLATLPGGVFRDLGNLASLSLLNNNLSSINPDWFATTHNLRSLNLDMNAIREVHASDFTHLHSLDELRLRRNLLTTFNRDAFLTLGNLSVLDISQNNISFLSADSFEGFHQLTSLDLHFNPLTFISERTFSSLPSLRHLDISRCLLESVHATAFEGLTNVREIAMEFNRLEELPAGLFRSFTNLTRAILWMNLIPTVSRDVFGDLTALIDLDLASNVINAVDRRIFDDATGLRMFRISNNLCADFSSDNFQVNRSQHIERLSECFRNYDMDANEITTDNSDTYLFHPASYPGMMIRVQASGELHIALTPLSFPWQPMVEIVIGAGNNTRSEIRRNQASVVAMAHTPNIVNATGTNEFTVTWANQLVLVSRTGEAFPFLGYMMEDFFRIHYHGLRTPTSTGLWNVRPF